VRFLLAPIDASLPPVREALVRVREEEESVSDKLGTRRCRCAVPVGAHRCQFATCPGSASPSPRGRGMAFAVSGLVTHNNKAKITYVACSKK
jgi:hypothetical protein